MPKSPAARAPIGKPSPANSTGSPKWASSSNGAGCYGSRIWRVWRRWFETRAASSDAQRCALNKFTGVSACPSRGHERAFPFQPFKKRPQAVNLRGFFQIGFMFEFLTENTGLLGGPRCDEVGRVDDCQRRGMLAALKVERLVVDAVDVNHFARVQRHANACSRTAALVGTVPHDDVHAAAAAIRLVEGDDPLAADAGEDRLVGSDRPEILGELGGGCGGAGHGESEGPGRSKPIQPVSGERFHSGSPFFAQAHS